MANKKTNKEFFAEVIALAGANQELADWATKQIKALDKKAENRKPTKTQEANIGLKAQIVAVLQALGKPATVSDLLASGQFDASVSNQKLTSLLTQMVKAQEVVRETDKKKAFFSVPIEAVEGDEPDTEDEDEDDELRHLIID